MAHFARRFPEAAGWSRSDCLLLLLLPGRMHAVAVAEVVVGVGGRAAVQRQRSSSYSTHAGQWSRLTGAQPCYSTGVLGRGLLLNTLRTAAAAAALLP